MEEREETEGEGLLLLACSVTKHGLTESLVP